jgi:hypothetical protein
MIGANTAIDGTNKLSGIGFAIRTYSNSERLFSLSWTLTSDLAQDAVIPVNLRGVYADRIIQDGTLTKQEYAEV